MKSQRCHYMRPLRCRAFPDRKIVTEVSYEVFFFATIRLRNA